MRKAVAVMASLAQAVDRASASFSGQLILPADVGYDRWRRVHNGLIDKRPSAIARCHGVADVVDAVKLARTLGLDVAVRGGGHNVAGHATADDGLLIDSSPMKGIHVDLRARTVRAEGGVLWKDLNRETQVHGLATTGGVIGSTGIAGLTLGGGIGWLMPKYGLALDNLRAADLITYLAPTRYLNYLEGDAVDPAAVAYGPSLDRLRQLKTTWDPDNFFRQDVNILPRSDGRA